MDLVEDGGQEDRGRRDIQGRQVERRFIRPVRGRQNWLTQALRWAAAPSWRRMAETNHDGCEQECGCWEEGFADALAGMQEWSITVHDGICRCEFCVTGIALIEAALGDMAGILREIRSELKPAEPSDELTVPGPAGGDPRPPAVFINSGRWSWPSGREGTPGRRAESPEQLPRHGYSRGISHGFTPGVDPPPYQGRFGEGEDGRQETGRSPPVVRGAGGRGHRDGGQRRQPTARCQVLRRIACDSQARRKA